MDIFWETQAQKLLLNDVGEISGVQVRKNDGRRQNIQGKKVMLSCGGFEGNKEMLARSVFIPVAATFPSLFWRRNTDANLVYPRLD